METSVQVAYRTAPAGRWPADYQMLDADLGNDVQDDGRYRQEAVRFTAASPEPYYIIVKSSKGTGPISFLAQEGVAAPPGPPVWLLVVTGIAVVVSFAALGLALRAWFRSRGSVTR